jgi:hypothetical protein
LNFKLKTLLIIFQYSKILPSFYDRIGKISRIIVQFTGVVNYRNIEIQSSSLSSMVKSIDNKFTPKYCNLLAILFSKLFTIAAIK